jgi:hypothetical protein
MTSPGDRAPPLGRRRLILRSVALGSAALTTACVPAQPVYAPRGTGMTDADPNDGPGNGRGGRGPSRGVTDSDPNDGPGRGRGAQRGGYTSGVTDRDPNDGPGRGRGGSRSGTGLTDSDPNDGPGRGRSGR